MIAPAARAGLGMAGAALTAVGGGSLALGAAATASLAPAVGTAAYVGIGAARHAYSGEDDDGGRYESYYSALRRDGTPGFKGTNADGTKKGASRVGAAIGAFVYGGNDKLQDLKEHLGFERDSESAGGSVRRKRTQDAPKKDAEHRTVNPADIGYEGIGSGYERISNEAMLSSTGDSITKGTIEKILDVITGYINKLNGIAEPPKTH